MSGDNAKVVRGVENQRAYDAGEDVGASSKESPAMGEVQPPKGLPPHIKCMVITYDTTNDNMQIAGPLNDEELINHMFYRAAEEVEKFWSKMKAEKNN